MGPKLWVVLIAVLGLFLGESSTMLCAQKLAAADHAEAGKSIPEEIEWTWEVRPTHVDTSLPNVLLLGDSITRNYYPGVTRRLEGKANVYLMASSTCVGDPRQPGQIAEFSAMEGVSFAVVHFNNGMHGWAYTEAQYKQAFPSFLHAIREAAPDARLIWATTTPVKVESSPGPTNARVDARNAIAKGYAADAGIPIDDQHALMMHHRDLYHDAVHFNEQGSDLEAAQATATILTVLSHSALPHPAQQ